MTIDLFFWDCETLYLMSVSANSNKNTRELFKYLVSNVNDYAIFALDIDGTILTWNRGSQYLHGADENEVIGKKFGVFYQELDQKNGLPSLDLKRAQETGSVTVERHRFRKDGSRFWAEIKIDKMFDDNNNQIGYAVIVHDLSDKKDAEASRLALAKSDETFNLLVAAVKDYAIFLLSPQGNILTWNEGARRNKGYESYEIIGRHFSTFYTQESKESGHPQWELEQAKEKGQYDEEGWRVRKDGSMFWASVSITAVKNREGHLTGFVKVTRDLTERREFELSLKRAVIAAESARDEAERANRLKSEFVATISHEIRTPMSGLIGLAELLMHEPDSEEVAEMAKRIFNSSSRLLTVLNDLLDFSKLESGKVSIETIAFSPRTVVHDVVNLVSPLAQPKSLALETKIGKDVPEFVFADENKVRQVLTNLLHNAIKFTSKGKVKISVSNEIIEQTPVVKFTVTDTGIGIREEHKSMMFEPFIQADPSSTRKFGGTGLGLSISRHYVTLMGGIIGLESTEGKGSTFWFTIPLKQENAND